MAEPVLSLVEREVRHGGSRVERCRRGTPRLFPGFSQHGEVRSRASDIDRESFEDKREAGFCLPPRHGHLLNSVQRKGAAWDGADQHGLELVCVQVTPGARRSMVVDAAYGAAVRVGMSRTLESHASEPRRETYPDLLSHRAKEASGQGCGRSTTYCPGETLLRWGCLKVASAPKITVVPVLGRWKSAERWSIRAFIGIVLQGG